MAIPHPHLSKRTRRLFERTRGYFKSVRLARIALGCGIALDIGAAAAPPLGTAATKVDGPPRLASVNTDPPLASANAHVPTSAAAALLIGHFAVIVRNQLTRTR
jgi:hypothetical protein